MCYGLEIGKFPIVLRITIFKLSKNYMLVLFHKSFNVECIHYDWNPTLCEDLQIIKCPLSYQVISTTDILLQLVIDHAQTDGKTPELPCNIQSFKGLRHCR